MTTLGDVALSTCNEISAADSIEMLSAIFEGRLRAIGMTSSACGMITGPKATSGDPFYFTNWPAEFHAVYVERNFMRIDPLPRWGLTSGRPVTWSELLENLPRHDPGHEVYREAQAWGFTEGLAVPTRSHSGALGLVTSGGPRSALSADEVIFLQIVSTAAFHKADALAAPPAPNYSLQILSRREQETLVLLHHGYHDREIAEALGISIETVRSHLDHAREKVGARSRTHLVGLTSGSIVGAS
jgi:LuxR family quorum sensing-dependent transcriptional regulator